MARIIEMCGSPGVGKSTIFKEIEKLRKPGESWDIADNKNPMGEKSKSEFLDEIISELKKGRKPINQRVSQLESFPNYIKRIYRKIKLGRKFVDLYILKQAGEKFVATYPNYVDALWKNIFYRQAESSNGMDLRFEKAEFIYLIMKKIQILKDKDDSKSYIIDEGLINMIDRGLYKSDNEVSEAQEIRELLDSMPWPDGIIYLQTDLKENARRIKYRKDIRDMHKGLTPDEIIEISNACRKRIITAINYLQESGCPVLYLDSTRPPKENANKIIDFVKSEIEEVSTCDLLQNKYEL